MLPKYKRSLFFFLLSSRKCSQIWLSPIVNDDYQPTYLRNLKKKTLIVTLDNIRKNKIKKISILILIYMALSNMNHIFGWFRLLIGQIDNLKGQERYIHEINSGNLFFSAFKWWPCISIQLGGTWNMYHLFIQVLYPWQYQVFT